MGNDTTRRVMETTCADTANQYLRFGWKLINQYVTEATADAPSMVKYVLASVRSLEDTRQVITLTDPQLVNPHLELGWKLIDKYVSASADPQRRDETLYFILAWQSEDPPARPAEAIRAESVDANSHGQRAPRPSRGQRKK
jgi:hypothetical protein